MSDAAAEVGQLDIGIKGVFLLTKDNAAPIGGLVGEPFVRGQPHIEPASVRVTRPASFVVTFGVLDQSGRLGLKKSSLTY